MGESLTPTRINVNNTVSVKLTERGKKVLMEFPQEVVRYGYEKETGVYTGELWNLMRVFGPHLFVGQEPLFDKNDIDIYLHT